METRKMDETMCKDVYTLNTWTDDKKAEARKYLEDGYWVHFGASCTGHTLARMVERAGIKWVLDEYGDNIQIAAREGWGDVYCRLR